MAKPPAPIRILKPGTFTDIHGTKVTFAQSDLDQMIASYDAASDPAPIVVGHPTTDAPAFGWIGRLAMEGGHLVAHPSEIAPAFAEVVAGGHYRKVSPRIYPPASPANPKPGSWYLQHVGFLGASAPAIKGMGTVAFAEDASTTITIDIMETEMTEQAPDAIAFAEQKAALDQREAEVKEREEALAKRDRDDRQAANVAFAEGLIAEAKLAPAGKDRVVGLLGILDAAQPVAFGEGDGATMTPLAAFQSLLKDGAPVIALGEHDGAGKPPAEEETPEHLAQRAVAFAQAQAAAGNSISVVEAVRHVRAHPDA